MRILHVEDDVDWFERVIRKRLVADGKNEVFHAVNKHSALNVLEAERIDYLIVDLAIPDVDGAVPEYQHGVALLHKVRENFPGMPILILTGQATEEAAQQFEDQKRVLFWDGSEKALVKTRRKQHLSDAFDLVFSALDSLTKLNEIQVFSDYSGVRDLDEVEIRIFRLFCLSVPGGSHAVKYSKVSGGLSGAKVYSVEVLDSAGQTLQLAIGKVASSDEVGVEVKNSTLLNRLPIGLAPVLLGEFFAGCDDTKGVFFRLADNHEMSFFDVLRESDSKAATLVSKLSFGMGTWAKASNKQVLSVAEIRRFLVSESKLACVFDFIDKSSLVDFESKELPISCCTVHGDLHGKNILVSGEYEPLLIDYGDVKEEAPCLIDPITLMLSPYFHPSTKHENYYVDESYSASILDGTCYFFNTKYPLTSEALLAWKKERETFPRDSLAVIYAYSLRQLTYAAKAPEEVNVPLAIGLINECFSRW